MWQREQALKVVSGGSSKASQLAQAREEVAFFFGSFAAIFFSADSSSSFLLFWGMIWPGGVGITKAFSNPEKSGYCILRYPTRFARYAMLAVGPSPAPSAGQNKEIFMPPPGGGVVILTGRS